MTDFTALLNESTRIPASLQKKVDAFLDPHASMRRYLLGKNADAAHLVAALPAIRFDGVIDDFAAAGQHWQGLPLVKGAAIDQDAIVVHCATSISPLSAHAMLERLGVTIIGYADLCKCIPALSLPDFVRATRDSVAMHRQDWIDLRAVLADPASRAVLDQLLGFRLTGDYRHMAGSSVAFQEQYFDPVVRITPDEVFVDCGGFDGDTTLEFIRRYPAFSAIYLFEPSPTNFAKAVARLDGIAGVHLIPLGVSDTPAVLSFDAASGSASAIGNGGSSRIEVVRIDDRIVEPVSFIKMDLEGWELKALQGARAHILADHPKLAISVYHQPKDFLEIPRFITGIRDDYDIHLRHYSEGWSETVMYFIPRRGGTTPAPGGG